MVLPRGGDRSDDEDVGEGPDASYRDRLCEPGMQYLEAHIYDSGMWNTFNRMKRNFRVGVRYTFEGAYTVRAVSDKEAARLVLRRCGLTCGNIHTTLDELTCPDWDFPTHPDTRIGNVEPIEMPERKA